MAERRVWVNRLVLFLLFALPLGLFVATQGFSNYTRSGNVDDVWFAQTPQGPRLIATDRIVVGTEKAAKVRHRLVVVDVKSGDRIARERLDQGVEFLDASPSGLWFWRKHDRADPHLRDPQTLNRIPAPPTQPPPTTAAPAHDAFGTQVTLPGGITWVSADAADAGVAAGARVLDAQRFPGGFILVDARSGQPLVLEGPSFLVAYRGEVPGVLRVSRLSSEGEPRWSADLLRQRSVRTASVLEDTLVVVSSGAARDFALAFGVEDGKQRWVHNF